MRRHRVLAPVAHWWGGVRPRRADLRADAVAGLPGAIGSVPDGMASAVLAGVNPVYGLYASMAGPLAGGLATSTRLMVISTTTAAALAAGSALESVPEADRAASLFVVADFARRLDEAGGRLYLSGLDPDLAEGLRRTGRVDVSGPVRLYEATSVVGSSTEDAFDAARAWVVGHTPDRP